MLELFEGALLVDDLLKRWYKDTKSYNCGAFISFVGTVRNEDNIDGLSFDIYEPILNSWFKKWQTKIKNQGARLYMAHSRGDVLLHQSSYIAAISSKKRKFALIMIDKFVEDFKANAPIWKYNLKKGKRIYEKDKSNPIKGSGVLA